MLSGACGANVGADEGYTGPAVLTVGGRELAVRVVLDARHEPQDGRRHWFGRLTFDRPPDPDVLDALARGAPVLAAGGSPARARLGDLDPWGRYRVTGVGEPPYPLVDPLAEEIG